MTRVATLLKPRFVRTVCGFGYAFAGEAEAAKPARVASAGVARRVLWEKRNIPLVEGEGTSRPWAAPDEPLEAALLDQPLVSG